MLVLADNFLSVSEVVGLFKIYVYELFRLFLTRRSRRSPSRSVGNMTDKHTGTDEKKVETESSSTETDNKGKVERRKSSYGECESIYYRYL